MFLPLLSSRYLYPFIVTKAEESSLFSDLKPSFQVIFHVICFSAQMKILRKIINCESLEISQENFYDEVSFSKFTSLHCSDCNFTIKRTHHRFFLEYVHKPAVLERIKKVFFWEKGLWWTSVFLKLQSCNTQPSVLWKKQSSWKTFP